MHIVDLPYHEHPPHELAALFADRPGCVFLDSAAQGRYGRYSFLAADPFLILSGKDERFTVADDDEILAVYDDPWRMIADVYARYRLPTLPGLPPLQGGLIGYWAYELGHHVERLPRPRYDDLDMPDLWLGAYDWVIAWDHVDQTCRVIATGLPATTGAARRDAARRRVQQVLSVIAHGDASVPLDPPTALMTPTPQIVPLHPLERWPGVQSTSSSHDYHQAVQRAIDYIYAGDVYQVNLSQRFEAPLHRHPWHIYTALRRRNPADFASYLHCGTSVIASASPERFLRLDGHYVETRPIKGTISRSSDPVEDRRRAQTLHTSPKDRAENLMTVDLLRNDIGRVCEIGTVDVPELWALEQHPTVYHLVSTVTGTLRSDLTPVDLLRACFPGGSITGAPKIRAMEIIAELEPTARGAYCGAIGYLGWNGQMDTNIVIRTYIMRQGRATWQAGGGIVADSTPEGEYLETLAKARALSEVMLHDDDHHQRDTSAEQSALPAAH